MNQKSNEWRVETKDHGTFEEMGMVSKNEFAKFIRERRREYNELHQEQLSTRKIAEILELNVGSFPKILNRERPTKHRDLIIAIGIVLELLPGEVSEALRLYGMPELEDQWRLTGEEVARDKFISKMLINNSAHDSAQSVGCRYIIRIFNEELERNGFSRLHFKADV